MTDIQCAIGLAQMKKFDTLVEKKSLIHKKYTEAFSEFKHVDIYQPPEEVSPYIPFRVILKTKKDEAEDLMQHMRHNDVEPRMFFYPLHSQPAFKCWSDDSRYNREHFPVAEKSYDNGICLPSFVNISEEQIDYVCKVIKDFYV